MLRESFGAEAEAGLPVESSSLNSDLNPSEGRTWVNVQKRTFTNWANSHLQAQKLEPLTDVTVDLSSGTKLLELLEILGSIKFKKRSGVPKLRIHKVENLNIALNFLRTCGVNLTNIGAEDVVDGNEKLILGLVWAIILRFSISQISTGGYKAKEALLLWCQRETSEYENDFKITDFSHSWKNGLAFCALIHSRRPDLLDYHKLDKSMSKENITTAFNIAKDRMNIPKLLEPADITDVDTPDERSVATYVSQYFHKFTAQDQKGKYSSKMEKFASDMKKCFELKNDYERKASELKQKLLEKIGSFKDLDRLIDSMEYEEVFENATSLIEFESREKKKWMTEKWNLSVILGSIIIKREQYSLEPYNPPEGLGIQDLRTLWSDFVSKENESRALISQQIVKCIQKVHREFESLALWIMDEIEVAASFIKPSGIELKDQLNNVERHIENLTQIESKVEELRSIENRYNQMNMNSNRYVILMSAQDVEDNRKAILDVLQKERSILVTHIQLAETCNLSSGRLKEITETFYHMDKDKDELLNKDELLMALNAEGLATSPTSYNTIYNDVFNGQSVNFNSFLEYMKNEGSSVGSSQLVPFFKFISGNKDYVTEEDIRNSEVNDETVDYLLTNMPKIDDDKYDHLAFIEMIKKNESCNS